MRAICPHCRKRVRFSFWRIDAMSLQCPICHTSVFKGFGVIEVLSVLAGLGAFGLAVIALGLKGYQLLLLALAIIAFEYAVRLVYIWIHNVRNENIY